MSKKTSVSLTGGALALTAVFATAAGPRRAGCHADVCTASGPGARQTALQQFERVTSSARRPTAADSPR